jgi:ATP-dependent Clp protease ATP-binding subunit ClpA
MLRLRYIGWLHGEDAAIAYFPELRIEVCSTKPATFEAVEQLAMRQIRAALSRRGALGSLARLALLQRTRDLIIREHTIDLQVPTPKQIAARDEHRAEKKKSTLGEAATDLTKSNLPAAYELNEAVAQLADALTGQSPRSVLLVGPSGVGKTAAVYELIRRRADFQLGFTPFFSTNGSRLVAGMSGFGQWQDRCTKIWAEAATLRAILYLGNFIELLEVGRSVGNDIGIADFLRPLIGRGSVLVIAEATPEQLALVQQRSPRMLEPFQIIHVTEPAPESTRNILLSVAIEVGKQHEIQIEALDRIDQLHRRYATYSASPGRPLRFLKNLLQDRPPGTALAVDDVVTAFSDETGLPRVLLDEKERLDLSAAREWFSARVLGQPDAIDLVVDLLATVKAGMVRPRKPIASLLFIGPTGVGKTEMAKSLAEFLFRDRARIVRFDMSEYADPIAVKRLIGSVESAEGLLTSRVREQPFAIVLLDEFEKADPSFFDLLLQVLGEGRLTDEMGRVADFSNAVVIMTSNLGAQSFQRGAAGFGGSQADREAAIRHFTNAVRASLRPEMFNRIDRIMPFAPLDKQTVLAIAEREIQAVKARDGVRCRSLRLHIPDEVIQHLADRGYDIRYGARPLKRSIERELLVPLAGHLNLRPADERISIRATVRQERIVLQTEFPQTASEDLHDDVLLVRQIPQLTRLRREASALARSTVVRNIHNEIFALERLETRLEKSKWKNPADMERVSRLPNMKGLSKSIDLMAEKIARIEEQSLLILYGDPHVDPHEDATHGAVFEKDWLDLLGRIYSLRFSSPDTIILAIYGENRQRLFEMAHAYYRFAVGQNAKIVICQFTATGQVSHSRKKKAPNTPAFDRKWIEKVGNYFDTPRPEVDCIALSITFPNAFARLSAEAGLHTFIAGKVSTRCLVEIVDADPANYYPPVELAAPNAIGHQEKRRNYNQDQTVLEDHSLRLREVWSGRVEADQIQTLIEKTYRQNLYSLLELT